MIKTKSALHIDDESSTYHKKKEGNISRINLWNEKGYSGSNFKIDKDSIWKFLEYPRELERFRKVVRRWLAVDNESSTYHKKDKGSISKINVWNEKGYTTSDFEIDKNSLWNNHLRWTKKIFGNIM